MTAFRYSTLCVFILLFLFLLSCGCSSSSVGEVSLDNGELVVPVTYSGFTGDGFVQVTIYRIDGFSQQELDVITSPAVFEEGDFVIRIPVDLPPGTYKLYIYLLINNDRSTAVIRDIVV